MVIFNILKIRNLMNRIKREEFDLLNRIIESLVHMISLEENQVLDLSLLILYIF
jgi:hypothetical protein